ncbi:hypothetical protein C8R45DRAFT_349501 [Mycena sanguinolenta]|nr:hypothetical protein C8R45DRAFT_349501 [Mycena sanguinolenta]
MRPGHLPLHSRHALAPTAAQIHACASRTAGTSRSLAAPIAAERRQCEQDDRVRRSSVLYEVGVGRAAHDLHPCRAPPPFVEKPSHRAILAGPDVWWYLTVAQNVRMNLLATLHGQLVLIARAAIRSCALYRVGCECGSVWTTCLCRRRGPTRPSHGPLHGACAICSGAGAGTSACTIHSSLHTLAGCARVQCLAHCARTQRPSRTSGGGVQRAPPLLIILSVMPAKAGDDGGLREGRVQRRGAQADGAPAQARRLPGYITLGQRSHAHPASPPTATRATYHPLNVLQTAKLSTCSLFTPHSSVSSTSTPRQTQRFPGCCRFPHTPTLFVHWTCTNSRTSSSARSLCSAQAAQPKADGARCTNRVHHGGSG